MYKMEPKFEKEKYQKEKIKYEHSCKELLSKMCIEKEVCLICIIDPNRYCTGVI